MVGFTSVLIRVGTAAQNGSGDSGSTGTTAQEADVTCGEGDAFCQQVLDWTGNESLANATSLATTLLRIGLILLLAFAANRLARIASRHLVGRLQPADEPAGASHLLVSARTAERAEQRTATISTVLRSVATAVIFAVAAVMILAELGIAIGPILASAGILGIALGFGAQSLIEDLLSGLSMLLEDQYGVGDRVDLGEGQVGVVEQVTMRTTTIRDAYGVVWHVPNGKIDRVGNLTQLWSRAVLDIGISYEADLRQAQRVIKETADEMWQDHEWADRLQEEPEVLGVQELGADAVAIRLRIRTDPGAQPDVERELRMRMKEALDEAGIEMPYTTRTVYLRQQPEVAAAS